MAYVPEWLKKQKQLAQETKPENDSIIPQSIQQLQKMRQKEEESLDDLMKYGIVQAEEQPASQDTQISSSNIGFKLLSKMGWKENSGLGKNEQGRVEPIRADGQDSKKGLGKESLDMKYAEDATKERPSLEIEREMTEEDKKNAKIALVEMEQLMTEKQQIFSDFYCEICAKQYKNISEMNNHLSSYDHNHKKRLTELKRSEGSRGEDERKKRQKREEEKELNRIQTLAASLAENKQPQPPQPPPPPTTTQTDTTQTTTTTETSNTSTEQSQIISEQSIAPIKIQSFSLGMKTKAKKK
eukprot:c15641_g1_i1.p1 GENE.c15641_g1_i1~~c15641_g1_i1.p1  ORF type:complete len:298 (+),score=129.72 c15641_g1_i1:78-971(+)